MYETNDILRDQSSGWGDIVRDTARDPMVWFLAGTSLLFATLGARLLDRAHAAVARRTRQFTRRSQAQNAT